VTLTHSHGSVDPAPPGTSTYPYTTLFRCGQCTITFTSNTAGKVTGHAAATLTVNGVAFTIQTNGVAPNSGDAVKTFVDANIQITPATAANAVGSSHALTGRVDVNGESAAL